MEPMISLMIVGNNKFMVEMLLEVFENYYDINVVGVTQSNLKAVDLIKELKPHIVLLDVFEPGINELEILTEASKIKEGDRPLFIILSEQSINGKIKKAITLGVEEYLVKPIDTDVLVSRIRQVYVEYYCVKKPEPFHNPDIVQKINLITAELLYNIGIFPHLLGYKYIKEAMFYMANDPEGCKPLSKVLYPLIAAEFRTTSNKVERDIRNAIENAWKKIGNLDENIIKENNMLKMFEKKPTNSQFISALTNLVKSSIENTDL